jgi:hypothetical protein
MIYLVYIDSDRKRLDDEADAASIGNRHSDSMCFDQGILKDN